MIGLESNGDSGKAIADTIKATTQDTVNSETIKRMLHRRLHLHLKKM